MHPVIIVSIVILSVILFAYLLLFIISHSIYKRSVMATLCEIYLRIKETRYKNSEMNEYFNNISKVNTKELIIPKYVKSKMISYNYMNMQTFVINNKSDKTIIYLHGAGYVRNPRRQHFKFIDKLSRLTNANIVFPIYPKAPTYDYKLSYEILTNLYKEVISKSKEVYLMGDSSGGGLALGLCISFIKNNIEQPKHLFLLSPWVDVSLDNKNIKDYIKKDPIVFIENDKMCGLKWANGTDLKDERISPLYGNMVGIKEVSIFVGNREVLYPDNVILYEILKESKSNVSFNVGSGLNHVYPIYPIPEAKKVLKMMKNIIKRG